MGYKINVYTGTQWKNILDHDLLANLQGGIEGEYYHLTATQLGYIDQDVTIGSSPSFYNTNMSGDISIWNNDMNYTVPADVQLEVFVQSTPSTTWNINHDFGTKYIMTQAFLDDDTSIQPTTLELTDSNNCNLTFDDAITGYVIYSKVVGLAPGAAPGADHGGLTGLFGDDHTQYTLEDGTRGFTGVVAGITPTADAHLTTKGYVDNKTWLSTNISDFDTAVDGNASVILNTTHRTSDGSDHTFIDQDVTIGSSPQFSNTNMYGPVSTWANDAGYIASESVTHLDAQESAPSTPVAQDLWVEII